MIPAIRGEMLRSVSGLSLWAAYLLTALVPIIVSTSDGTLSTALPSDDGIATARLLHPVAWAFVGSAFVGAYSVTREYYYASMDRTLTSLGFRRAFLGKLIAGLVVSLGMTLCLLALWTLVVAVILAQEGRALTWTPSAVQLLLGAVAGAALGALVGGAVGWITRNYYVAAGLILLIPIGMEFALRNTAPDIARFSPGLAMAALAVPEDRGELLPLASACATALAWTAGLLAVAWFAGRRRRA